MRLHLQFLILVSRGQYFFSKNLAYISCFCSCTSTNYESPLAPTKNKFLIRYYGFTIRYYGFTIRYYGFTIRNYGFTIRHYGFTIRYYGFTIRYYGFTIRYYGFTKGAPRGRYFQVALPGCLYLHLSVAFCT